MIQPYFEVFYSLLVNKKLQNIEDPSLVILGYQLLPLDTSKLMGDNHGWVVNTSEHWKFIIGWP